MTHSPPGKRIGPAANGTETKSLAEGDKTRVPATADVSADVDGSDYLDPHHILAAWGSGTARYWRRRAQVYLAARPTEGDYLGNASPDQLADQWDRLTAQAQACENRALIAERFGPTPVDRALIHGVAESLLEAA